ncbi:MAG TPA: hypothetical protein VF310_05400 [Vicinamibacteria bacterium]
MTSAIASPRRSLRAAGLALAVSLAAGGCATFVEVPVETPLQSKIDVSSFRRVLVAGFATELGDSDVELGAETTRLLQNQLRSSTKLQVLEPDRPPLHDALERALEKLGEGGKYSKQEKEQYRLETDRILKDAEYWRQVGEEFQNPLIVTGRVGFEQQNRSGFQTDERVIRDPATGRPRLVRGNRYLERKGFSLNADFYFVDGRTGETLHKEKFTEEVLYSEEQKVSPLSSYFELMDRLLPNFLGVISPQKIRGTRVLLQ